MKALDLVGHIVAYSEEAGRPATNIRLQALLYLIQQEYLNRYGKTAFEDATEYAGEIIFFSDVYYEYVYSAGFAIINIPPSPIVDDLTANCVRDVVFRFAGVPTWKLIAVKKENVP